MTKFLVPLFIMFHTHGAFAVSPRVIGADIVQGIESQQNFIKNPEFEKNKAGITDSSTIATFTTTTPVDGDGSLLIDATTSGQIVRLNSNGLTRKHKGLQCEAKFYYSGDASLYKAYVNLAGSQISVTNPQLVDASTNSKKVSIPFPCGTTGDQPDIMIEATSNSAAAIKVDAAYLGLPTISTLLSFTPGSIPFAGSTGLLTESNTDLFFDGTNKRIGLGLTTPSRTIEIYGQSAATADGVSIRNFNNSASAGPLLLGAKSRGTIASPTATQSGDFLLSISGNEHNGTAFQTTSPANISFLATENASTTAAGTSITFATTGNTTLIRKSRLKIDQDGAIVLTGNTSGTFSLYPAAATTNYSVILPSAQGSGALTNDGSGNLSWAAGAGSQTDEHVFELDGPYAAVISTSATDQGKRFVAPYNLKIVSVCMYVKTKGTSGTTTLDLKKATKAVPNTFATIFSTAPAATTTITNGEYKCTGDTGTGWTIPVMSPNPFLMNQYDTLRLDVAGVMAGSEDAGLVIVYQPQ